MEYIIAFGGTNLAIKAEGCLAHLRVGVLPLPAQISAGCGICLKVPPGQIGTALKDLERCGVGGFRLFARKRKDGGYTYTEITDRGAAL